MNTFIFQSTPDRYDLRKSIIEDKPNTWYATRYRSDMRPGDLVFFWMAGNEYLRGLYGWGYLTSTPYLRTGWDSHGVDVIYKARFSKPILAKSFRDDPELAEMLIFRAPQATNFLLSPEQAKRLIQIVKDRGESVPPSITEGAS
jgi:hypothetical protein